MLRAHTEVWRPALGTWVAQGATLLRGLEHQVAEPPCGAEGLQGGPAGAVPAAGPGRPCRADLPGRFPGVLLMAKHNSGDTSGQRAPGRPEHSPPSSGARRGDREGGDEAQGTRTTSPRLQSEPGPVSSATPGGVPCRPHTDG